LVLKKLFSNEICFLNAQSLEPYRFKGKYKYFKDEDNSINEILYSQWQLNGLSSNIDNKQDSCKDDNKQNSRTSIAIETPALLDTTSAKRKGLTKKAALKKERDFKNVRGYPEVEESWRRLRIQTSFANAKQQPKNLMKLLITCDSVLTISKH
jgi:hypothetical protein